MSLFPSWKTAQDCSGSWILKVDNTVFEYIHIQEYDSGFTYYTELLGYQPISIIIANHRPFIHKKKNRIAWYGPIPDCPKALWDIDVDMDHKIIPKAIF